MASPLGAIGLGMQAGSSILGGFFGANQAQNEARVAKYNALLKLNEAKAVEQKTKFEQVRQAEEGARIQGELEAGIGGSGTVSTQGAPLLSLALQKSESNLQNYLIGYQGRVEAGQLRSQAQIYLMESKMAKNRARQSMIGGFLGAGSSALQGLASMPKTTNASSVGSSYSSTANTTSGRVSGSGYSSINLPSYR